MKKYISLILSFLILLSSVSSAFASESSEGKYVYRNDTYDFKIDNGDPMVITDEQFFGVWDEETQTWTTESYFKYGHEDFPGLAPVEEAAKAGDYAAAKEALYAYYLPKKYDLVPRVKSISSQSMLDSALLARNFYAGETTGDALQITDFVGTEWQKVSADAVLSYVKEMVSLGGDYITFVVASIDKSNTPAEIKSRDTDQPPTLNLTANKVQKSFTACQDGYISPTTNANTVYGSEEILLAQEYGYISQWSDPKFPWGAEASATKRAYIQFDISELKETDDISSATFEFTARTAPGGDLEEKELFIYGWGDNTWKESNLRWNSFTDWLFMSTNEQEAWSFGTSHNTSQKGKMCYFHRGGRISPPAQVYDYTQDEQYAYTFIRQMMSLANRVEPNVAGVFNELDACNHVRGVGQSFIWCWGSEAMTAERFTALFKHFLCVLNFYVERMEDEELVASSAKFWGNWCSNMTRGTYFMCQAYPELKQADFLYDVTLRHNKRMYEYFPFEDGVYKELALGYVKTALGTISGAMEVMDEVKNQYYGMFCDEDAAELVLKMVKNWYYSMAPGYTGFNIGDSCDYGVSYKANVAGWYNRIKKYFDIDDPELAYVATNGARGKLPDFTSISFPVRLATYMRSDWSEDAIALAFSAKQGEGSHQHFDVMNVALMAYGQHLIIDPSYGSILTGTTHPYMSHAAQHNTITVNGGNLAAATTEEDGELVEQEIDDLYDMVTYRYVYGDYMENFERTVMFLKNQKFYIITDYVVPEDKTTVNTFTQFWHMQPMANISLTEDGKNELRSNFASGANVIVTPVDSESMSDIRFEDTLYGPSAGVMMDNIKGVYERKSMNAVKYGTVVYPLEAGDDRNIVAEPLDVGVTGEAASAFRLRITNPEDNSLETYYYYHLNDLAQKRVVTLGKYKTDATAMLVQEDSSGKVVSFLIYDGSYIESSEIQDKYLFKTANDEKVTLSANFNAGNFAEIAAENIAESDLDKITLYTGFDVSTASFNGERVINSSKDGAYIYFGDTPIVVCTETPPANNNSGESFGGFTGGGGGGGGGAPSTPKDETEEDKTDEEIKEEDEDADSTNSTLKLPTYSDVKVSDWHYEFVEELTRKEILSGDGTGRFAPNNNVTREQFLKMLMLAAEIERDEAENTFDDVVDSAWYKEFVLTAKKLGIVNGVSDTEFGIGANITRQDMAVMIARLMEVLGIEVSGLSVTNFADASQVSSYAIDSVRFMKAIGLIEGYNNEFRPKDNLTRAEAAKVISEFIKYIDVKTEA